MTESCKLLLSVSYLYLFKQSICASLRPDFYCSKYTYSPYRVVKIIYPGYKSDQTIMDIFSQSVASGPFLNDALEIQEF